MKKAVFMILGLWAALAVNANAESDAEWMRRVSAGFSTSGGNTEKGSANAELFVSRKTEDDEGVFKVTSHLGSSEGKLDSKKFYGLFRYDNKFGPERRWYQFGKLEGTQDVFANINYRITPGYGVGRWFYDEADFKLKAETALGYQYTDYRDSTKDEGDVVLIPRAYLEKQLLENLRLTEDITLYPSLEGGAFRLRSETNLVSKINDRMSWKFGFVDDYDSDAAPGTKKNDYVLTAGIDYNF